MKYVIIGSSAAGLSAAETIRNKDKKSDIAIISDEKEALYSRCLLTYFISGSIDEKKLGFKKENFFKENSIKTYLGKKAVKINPDKKEVVLEDNKKISYDKLLIATGAEPKLMKIPGSDKKGVFTIRRIWDAREIIDELPRVKKTVVLGGGLIGLRDAYALRQKGKDVTVVVKSPQVLSQMLDADAAKIIASIFEKNGIKILTGVDAKEIAGKDSVESVLLDNGQKIDCQLVIVGKGVTPNTDLASGSGLKVDGAVTVDEYLRTSDKDIFAAGDAVQTYDIARGEKRINAIWPSAVEQGKIAGLNMTGEKKIYDGSLSMNSVDFFGLGCISIGITKPEGEGCRIISKTGKDKYRKLILKDKKIVGVVLVGDIRPAGIIGILIKSGADISIIEDILLDENFSYTKIMPVVKKFQNLFKSEEYKDTLITY